MSEDLQVQTCERIFKIISTGIPMLFEAGNYVENKNRITPYPVFIEGRDVLSHLRDIATNPLSKENIDKNLVEMEEHIRRGIVETYQEHYEYLCSNVFRSYGKYKQSFIRFEGLLGLQKKHEPLHKKINSVLKSAQNLWMEARNLKNNELNSPELAKSISNFKEAGSLISSIEHDVEVILGNFYKRGVLSSFIFIFSFSVITVLILKLFLL